MATRGKATKFTVEKAMLMLDSSFSGSELEGFESDDSLEENEQEAGCIDDGASHGAEGETSTEPELTLADGGASHDSGGAEGETSTEPELTFADGGARSQSEGESDPESNTESEHETPSLGNKVIPPKCLSLHAHYL